MLTDLFYSTITIPLKIINFLFSAINFLIPDAITNSIEYFIAYLGYLTGVFPIDQLLLAMTFLITLTIAVYTAKLTLIALSFMGGIISGGTSLVTKFIK